MQQARRYVGWAALGVYLIMGATLHFTVLPGAGGLWPPDFHLRGYDAVSMAPFVEALTPHARDAYATVLLRWDRIFIVALALWLALVGWRGGALRYWVAGLAVIYALVDLAENAAIYRFVCLQIMDPRVVEAASQLTMAKFASLYLCVLVLIWHVRGTPRSP